MYELSDMMDVPYLDEKYQPTATIAFKCDDHTDHKQFTKSQLRLALIELYINIQIESLKPDITCCKFKDILSQFVNDMEQFNDVNSSEIDNKHDNWKRAKNDFLDQLKKYIVKEAEFQKISVQKKRIQSHQSSPDKRRPNEFPESDKFRYENMQDVRDACQKLLNATIEINDFHLF